MTVNQPVPEQPEKKPRLEDGADGMDIDPEEAEGCSPTKTKRRRFSNKDHVHGLMRRYYDHIFPHEAMYQWLVYGHGGKHIQVDETFFQRREFCFTLDGDIFVRYQSFKDGAEMRSAILRKCPAKIDIGPVYTVDPARRHAYAAGSGQGRGFHPVERELVFDIDLTDYDDVRNCGKGGHICCRCWPLMAVAIQVLDAGLRQDFGFQNILWVFSGRRGVHCWVCDARARRLTDEQRSSIASFFGIYKGREKDAVKLATSNYQHPAVARAHKLLLDAWTNTVLTEQRILDTPCTASEVLKMVPDEAIVNHLKAAWQLPAAVKAEPGVKCEPGAQCEAGPEKGGGEEQEDEEEEQAPSTSLDRWNELAALVEKKVDRAETAKIPAVAKDAVFGCVFAAGKKNPRLRRCLADIVFAFCYPRLDIEVSRKMNHLLKAPFCIHPKTGKLCAPIDPASAWQFNPEDVPTAAEMLNEFLFDSSPDEPMARRSHAMDDAVNTFKATFLDRLQDDVQQQLKERTRAQVQAKTLAW